MITDVDGKLHRFESIQKTAEFLDVDSERLRLYVHGVHRKCKGLDPRVKIERAPKQRDEYLEGEAPYIHHRS